MKQTLIFWLLLFLPFARVKAQEPVVEWQRSYGGSGYDWGTGIKQTSDGGYISVGVTNSADGDVASSYGSYDLWIIKTDASGTIDWERTIGGTGAESGKSVVQTADGGYIVAGSAPPDASSIFFGTSNADYFIVKLDAAGNIQWQKTYGGSGIESICGVYPAAEGGYIAAGTSYSNDGDVTGNQGEGDVWLLKLNNSGTIEWQKCFGGSRLEDGNGLLVLADGYLICGNTSANGGNNGSEGWVIRIDLSGNIQWETMSGNSTYTSLNAAQACRDGGFILAGESYQRTDGTWDFYVLKTDGQGNIQWQNMYGGTNADYAYAVLETHGGGFVVAGYGVPADSKGLHDYWVLKLNPLGVPEWQKSLGGSAMDFGTSIQQTGDDGFIITGSCVSADGDVTLSHGGNEFWTIKLSPEELKITGDTGACPNTTLKFANNRSFATEWWVNQQYRGVSREISHTFPSSGIYLVKTAYTISGITYSDSHWVEIHPKPEIVLADTVTACEPLMANICAASNQIKALFLWDDLLTDSCRTITKQGFSRLTVSNLYCSSSDSVFVIENKKPVFRVVQSDTICLDGSNFTSLFIVPIHFPYIKWENNPVPSPILKNYDLSPKTAEVKDRNGCSAKTTYQPLDGCKMNVFIPNTFTPNGDGLNEVFQIEGSGIAAGTVKIFNRWGQLIFESADIQGAWDGSYKGQTVPDGIYFVLVKAVPENELYPLVMNYSGTVVVLK